MKNLGYYNGTIGELNDMKVDFNDRACCFGDGLYEVAYCYNQRVFALQEHIDRFFASAEILGINLSYSKSNLYDLIYDLIKKVDGDALIVYWQASRGTSIRDHSYGDNIRSNLCLSVKQGSLRDYNKPIKVMLTEDVRHSICNIKTLNLLPNVMALHRAEKYGCQEVIFHRNGRITECAHSNVSILKDGVLITPPADNLILAGTCRAHLIDNAKRIGLNVMEKEFFIDELINADQIIITAAGSMAIGVKEIEGKNTKNKDRDILLALRKNLVNEYNDYTSANYEVSND